MVDKLVSAKEKRYSRKLHCYYASAEVTLGKRRVKVFFCKRGKHESWKLLLTTDVKLDFFRAYEIYAMRWAIEVFFSDSKRLPSLAECSARDFSSQIAHVALVMIRYNLFAMSKRTHDNETIGALFSEIYMGVHEITVMDKIWAVIIEAVAIVAEKQGVDDEILMEQIIADNKRLAAMQAYAETA